MIIRKIIVCCEVLVISISLMSFSACNKKKEKAQCKYYMIETTDQSRNSAIKLYDDNMEKIDEIKCDCANLGSVTSYAKEDEKSVYIIAQDIKENNGITQLIKFDKKTKKIEKCNLKYPMVRDFCLDENEIYTFNSMANDEGDMQSYIVKYDKEDEDNSKKIQEISLDNIILSNIVVCDDKIFGVGMNYDEDGKIFSKMYEINKKDMKLEKEQDITNYAVSVNSSCFSKGKIYFSTQTVVKRDTVENDKGQKELEDIEENADSILEYDIEKDVFKNIKIGFMCNQIFEYEGKLVLTNYDIINDEGNKIILYDVEKDKEEEITLQDKIREVCLEEDYLWVMGEDKIFKLDITNKFKNVLEKELDTDITKSAQGYNSSFVINVEKK